mgnify:CR=1 FL=1
MLESIKVSNYEFDVTLTQDAYVLCLEGIPLVSANAYLAYKGKRVKTDALRNKAQMLKTYLSQVLTDYNDWMFLEDDRENPEKNRYVKASTAHLEVNDSYVSGYLSLLARGGVKFTKGEPLENSSITQHIHVIREFYEFCYDYGLSSFSPSFSYLYDKYTQKQTATIGLDKAIHDLYYDEVEFNKLLNYLTTINPFLHERDRLILLLCYYSGIRPHELIKFHNFTIKRLLKVIDKHAPFNASTELIVTGKGTGAGKLRKIIIPPQVYAPLKKFLYVTIPLWEKKQQIKFSGSIFISLSGKPLKSSSCFNDQQWKKMVNAYISKGMLDITEIELWKKRDLYSTRHCFATNHVIQQRKEGKRLDQIALKELMGHSNFSTTLASYIYLAAVLTEDENLKSFAVDMSDKDHAGRG